MSPQLIVLLGPAGSGKSTAVQGIPNSISVYEIKDAFNAREGISAARAFRTQTPLESAPFDFVFLHVNEMTQELCDAVRIHKCPVVFVVRALLDVYAREVDRVIVNNDTPEALRACMLHVLQECDRPYRPGAVFVWASEWAPVPPSD